MSENKDKKTIKLETLSKKPQEEEKNQSIFYFSCLVL